MKSLQRDIYMGFYLSNVYSYIWKTRFVARDICVAQKCFIMFCHIHYTVFPLCVNSCTFVTVT